MLLKSFHFSSERKAMGAVVKLTHVYHLYIKGASEILTKLSRCASPGRSR